MTDGVPLVIPEVNPDAMKDCKVGKVSGCYVHVAFLHFSAL